MEPFIVPKRKRFDSMSMVSSKLKIDRVEILVYWMKRVFVAGMVSDSGKDYLMNSSFSTPF